MQTKKSHSAPVNGADVSCTIFCFLSLFLCVAVETGGQSVIISSKAPHYAALWQKRCCSAHPRPPQPPHSLPRAVCSVHRQNARSVFVTTINLIIVQLVSDKDLACLEFPELCFTSPLPSVGIWLKVCVFFYSVKYTKCCLVSLTVPLGFPLPLANMNPPLLLLFLSLCPFCAFLISICYCWQTNWTAFHCEAEQTRAGRHEGDKRGGRQTAENMSPPSIHNLVRSWTPQCDTRGDRYSFKTSDFSKSSVIF